MALTPDDLHPSPGWLAPGRRVYAIGDVHGSFGALRLLHEEIAADLAARPVPDATLVHLGDYVDRGPDSAAVLDLLCGPLPGGLPARVINLMGNHEAMMLEALAGDLSAARLWLANGGVESLESWNVRLTSASTIEPDGWRSRIPAAHLALLRGLRTSWQQDGYFFAHAGVRPEIPFSDSAPHDLLWIREPFLSWPARLERVVVHGHTPARRPTIRRHRIGTDTGAVFGGPLTCAVLEEHTVAFLSVPVP